MTVQNRLITTVTQIIVLPGYWIIRRIKFTTARTNPTITPTRTSFHTTIVDAVSLMVYFNLACHLLDMTV